MELIAKKRIDLKIEKGNSDENKVTENKTLKLAHKLRSLQTLNQTSTEKLQRTCQKETDTRLGKLQICLLHSTGKAEFEV